MTFLGMRTRAALKKNKCLRATAPYREAASFGILFTAETAEKNRDVTEIIRQLQQDGKHTQTLGFLPRKKDNPDFPFDFFSVQDVSVWGEIKSPKALEFADRPFDYLFCLDYQPNPFLLYLLARSRAHCRVGKHIPNAEAYFEMMIEHNGTQKGLLDNMLKYTQRLR
jgi:hypothetical protein